MGCKQSSHPSLSTVQGPAYRTFEELLLQLGLGDLDLDGAVNLLLVAALVIGIVFDGGREQGVDEGSLSQSRLSGNLQTGSLVLKLNIGHSKLRHTIIVKAAPRFATILCLDTIN
jgi:hypothetical protein